MKHKTLSPLIIGLALILAASAAWADSDWAGTFWETDPSQLPGISGKWEGTLFTTSTLPIRFLGTWTRDNGETGTFGGEAILSSATGDYCVLRGWAEVDGDTLYDCWKGCFNEEKGEADGTWYTDSHHGEWKGKIVE